MSEKMKDTTTVESVDVNIDEIFNGAPGADSIVTSDKEVKKPNIFSKPENIDLSFLDSKEEVVEEKTEEPKTEEPKAEETSTEEVKPVEKVEAKEEAKPEIKPEEVDEILNEGLEVAEGEDENSTVSGRKRMEGMADVFKKMIDDNQIIPFDDEKELDEYSRPL